MTIKVLNITHLTNSDQQREEFYCPLLDSEGVAHVLRIELMGRKTLHLTGMTSSRIKLWTAEAKLEEVK